MSRSPCCSQWLRSQRPQARKPRSNRANHKRIADEHPAILPAQSGHVSYDADPEQAQKTRHKFYDMATAEKALIASFHFSFPNAGHGEKAALHAPGGAGTRPLSGAEWVWTFRGRPAQLTFARSCSC